jgi:hypothetical protein
MQALKKHAAVWSAALALVLVWGTLTASAAVKVPPSIDDLDGTFWVAKVGGTEYDLALGWTGKIKGAVLVQLTKTGSTTVLLDFDDPDIDDYTGFYDSGSGILVIGKLNDAVLSTDSTCGFFTISGTPGKMKLKGQAVMYDSASDEEAASLTLSGKQVLP